jgi:hemerythrin-like metal-binding protein/PAS domain S-box-containing protein
MNINKNFFSLKNMSVFGKLNLFLSIILFVILLGILHISKLRVETQQVNLRDFVVNKLIVHSQQIGLYSELVVRESYNAKVELDKASSLFEKYLYTLRNGGDVVISAKETKTLNVASERVRPLILEVEKQWIEIKENADIIVNHETFVGGTEMATGSFDSYGRYTEMQIFKPISPEVMKSLSVIEGKLTNFNFVTNELVQFFVYEKQYLNERISFLLFIYVTIIFSIAGLGIFIFRYTLIKKLEDLLFFTVEISSGNLQEKFTVNGNDEINRIGKSLELLRNHLKNAIQFIHKIGNGNLTEDFKIQSEEDELGKSLNLMKETMLIASKEEEKRKKEDEIRNWTTQGIAKFGELLRTNSNDVNELSYTILSNLIEYIGANLGGVYIIEEADKGKYIDLVAAYAYDRRKYLSKRLQWGESLVGRAAQEKKTIYLTEIPDSYINISSGLGFSHPTCLVLSPLINNDQLFGVIELASLNKIEKHHIEFIERISESIASTIATVKINMTTSRLLEESSQQAEQLAQQEEEMRQNMEEMQATQEEAAIRTKEMEGIITAINNSTGSYEINLRGKIVDVNDIFAKKLKVNKFEIIGITHKDWIIENFENPVDYDFMWNEVVEGKNVNKEISHHTSDGRVWFHEVYNAVYDTYGDIKKVLVLASDVTVLKKQENDIREKLEEIEKFHLILEQKDKQQEETIKNLKIELAQQIEEVKQAEENLNAERQSRMEQIMAKEFELQAQIDLLKKENLKLKEQSVSNTEQEDTNIPDVLMEWTDNYSVGYDDINNQHKELLNLINKLYSAFKQGKAQKELKQILKDLITYTGYHFKTEERYFTEFNYVDANNHIAEHKKLVEKIVDFQKQLEAGNVALSYDVMNFLKDWLEKHILETDMKYVGKLGNNNSQQSTSSVQDEILISWENDYNTDIQLIDDQHKILVDLINQFYVSFKNGRAKKQVKNILKGLTDYTEYHFGVEEKYFKQFKYENEAEHLALHKVFVEKINQFQSDYNSGKITLSYDIMNFLKDWLVNHILLEDRKYIALFKDKGVK